MDFDACEHKIRNMVIKVGKLRRKELGLPEVKNITAIFNEMAPLLGIVSIELSSLVNGDHLPSPEETGPFGECPKCHKQTLVIKGLCLTCSKAEGGKYKTEWKCVNKGCDYDEVSTLFLLQAYNQLGIAIPQGMKQHLGIKTVTDDGEK